MNIVLVEPSSIGRRILTEKLTSAGHQITAFHNALEALRFIRDHEIVDGVLTSFETEGISGMELVWESRLLTQESRQLYIIAMSSIHEISKAVEALDCGADDFIRKPPVYEELFAKFRAGERLLTAQRRLYDLSARDDLTGLLNRRAFMNEVQRKMDGALGDAPVSFFMYDIDRFKEINDVFGHAAGDVVIQEVAAEISRQHDIAGRLGGDEFGVFAIGLDQGEAIRIAECVRKNVASMVCRYLGAQIKVTLSGGLWVGSVRSKHEFEFLRKRSDDALYQAKRSGKNRVQLMDWGTEMVA